MELKAGPSADAEEHDDCLLCLGLPCPIVAATAALLVKVVAPDSMELGA